VLLLGPIQALVYGVIQGLTEFLPVSSSGHLVLVGSILGIETVGVTLEVMVHFSTLLAVLIVYWKDIWEILVSLYQVVIVRKKTEITGKHKGHEGNVRFFFLLVIATVPAAVLGFLLKSGIEKVFELPIIAGVMLLVTGMVLFLVSRLSSGKKEGSELGFLHAVGIGMAQAVAILPGISRSGLTIASGLVSGLSREQAAKFSFLLSIPVILGATVLELKDMTSVGLGAIDPFSLVLSMIASFLSGLFAIKLLLKVLKSGNLKAFAYYCWIIGGIVILNWLYGCLA
jgi:undecaprenyl-diphosphatase